MNDVERLLAIEDIKRLKARYFRCVDSKDWTGFATIFAPDAHFDISDDVPGCVLTGRDRIVEAASVPLAQCVTVHHGHCPEIEITSASTASGIWAMEDVLRWPEGSGSPIRSLHGYGHYHETYQKIGATWHIQTMKLKRLRVDVEQAS